MDRDDQSNQGSSSSTSATRATSSTSSSSPSSSSSSSITPTTLPSEFLNFINAISAYEADDTEVEFRNDMDNMFDVIGHGDEDDDEVIDDEGDEEDEEEDEDDGMMHREADEALRTRLTHFSSTAPHLSSHQIHLASPRGRFIPGGAMAHNSPQFKAFLQQITSDDPTIQLLGLEQLAQDLIISQEDDLAGNLHPPSFIRTLSPLISLNSYLFGSQVSLLASRCVAHLLEVLPAPTISAIHADRSVIPGLCGHLREIVDMDVTEQALLTLSKLAHSCGAQIIRAGGLPIILAPLSFFEIRTQRTAVSCVATCCGHLDPGMVEEIIQTIPSLREIITSSSPSSSTTDTQVLVHACTAWARIVERYSSHPNLLERIIDSEIIQGMIRLLSPIGSPHASTVLRFLIPLTSHSSECQKALRDPVNLELLSGWLNPPQGTMNIQEVLNLLRRVLPAPLSFREYRKSHRKGGKAPSEEDTDRDQGEQGGVQEVPGDKEWLRAANEVGCREKKAAWLFFLSSLFENSLIDTN